MASGFSRRPHRQARSGVSYRDPHFDYEEDLAPCRRPRSSVTSTSNKRSKRNTKKRNLNSNLTSIAKERAEAVQLLRAINESLLEKEPEAVMHLHKPGHEDFPDTQACSITSSFNNEKDVEKDIISSLFDLKEVTMDQSGYSFQCLLDVASGAVLEGDIRLCGSLDAKEVSVEVQDSENQVVRFFMEKPQSDEKVADQQVNMEHSQSKEDPPVNVKVDPIDQEDDASKHTSAEGESSDLSDESGWKRAKPRKVELEGRRSDTDIVVAPGQTKTARSVRPVVMSKAETLSFASRKALHLQANKKLAQRVTACGAKENIPTCRFTSLMESTQSRAWKISYLKPQVAAKKGPPLGSCQSVQNICGPCEMGELQQSFNSVSPCQEVVMRFPAESSTLFHRRVIGLSRRFRPPPLHPYLSRRPLIARAL